jgi:hypothetical protein
VGRGHLRHERHFFEVSVYCESLAQIHGFVTREYTLMASAFDHQIPHSLIDSCRRIEDWPATLNYAPGHAEKRERPPRHVNVGPSLVRTALSARNSREISYTAATSSSSHSRSHPSSSLSSSSCSPVNTQMRPCSTDRSCCGC